MTRRAAAPMCAAALAVMLALPGCADRPARLSALPDAPPPPLLAPPPAQVAPAEAGRRLLAAGEPELALRRFEEALLADPRSGDALVGAGVASFRLGRLVQARRFLERAVEVAPENAAAWNGLGVVLSALGNQHGAHEALRTAFALDGGRTPEIRTNLALVEHRLSQPVDADSVVAEFELRQTGAGVYRLIARGPAPSEG
ncbi:MAG: tetratricopeptide repeat protein [Alphaproteobacteria bacterium]|nr:MAG: tetratricopeptide repeat protein [Alphaproteobacteria bacterium]